MVATIFMVAYLGWIALKDAAYREVPVRTLCIGFVVVLGFAGWYWKNGMINWESLALGFVPGMILLMLSVLTKGAGVGDAIVLFQMNLLLFWDQMIMAFGISLLAMGIFSGGFLLLKKVSRDARLPYLPFLWLGYVGMLCIHG